MGYMGFGLQSWIYNQKPRKGFDKYKQYIDVEDSKKNLDYHGSIEDFNLILEKQLQDRKWKHLKRFYYFIGFVFVVLIIVMLS